MLVAETYVQGPRAAAEIVAAIGALCEQPDVDVIVLTRGGGSFEDLLPFSDERVVRAVAECRVPVVSAVGHEQDTPLCDLAADVRASTPTAAGKLVVPELTELSGRLDRARETLARSVRRTLERDRQRLDALRRAAARSAAPRPRAGGAAPRAHARTAAAAPALTVERKRAALENSAAKLAALSPVQTLERGYAIVRTDSGDVVAAAEASPRARASTSRSPTAASARASRR